MTFSTGADWAVRTQRNGRRPGGLGPGGPLPDQVWATESIVNRAARWTPAGIVGLPQPQPQPQSQSQSQSQSLRMPMPMPMPMPMRSGLSPSVAQHAPFGSVRLPAVAWSSSDGARVAGLAPTPGKGRERRACLAATGWRRRGVHRRRSVSFASLS
ncbi:Uncharacterised protein [Burkholderia pseudomallei]|nr:Uncharacterised protein [Burkholderia pseudomallei]VBR76061.1 Uncharacterised protein [Burkholderia pseudomallei]